MYVPTRMLAILALVALVPMAAYIAYQESEDNAERAPDPSAAAAHDTTPEPAGAPAPANPEPLARALAGTTVQADTTDAGPDQAIEKISEQLAKALDLINQQQTLLESQTAKLDSQTETMTAHVARMQNLEAAFDALQAQKTLADTGIDVSVPAADQTSDLPAVSITPLAGETDTEIADGQPIVTRSESAETAAVDAAENKQEDDPTRVILNSLPGAMRLPGTNTVMKWGGFVKSTVVNNFDPLATDDRFITGAIPVSKQEGIEAQTTINVNQSRLNLDMREPTSVGLLRAFVEGDFDGNGETFRLRHAFGQRGNVLVGKTWSGFVDRSASPEEVDFEGLNGRINVRQAQVRFQPGFGRRYEMAVSIENPDPEVTGGTGVSQVPDLVVSGRINFRERFHTQLAMLLRQIRAQPDDDNGGTEREFGYALQLSGSMDAPWLDDRDRIMMQLNVGRGYGRYVNDLNTVGSFDGIFSPDGELKLIDVVAGYVSAQHWWRSTLRSNLTFGFVQLDNPDFVDGSFYNRTLRMSGNLFWNPTPRFDLGAELLWGRRENENGAKGSASQFQLAAKYLF